MKGASVMSVEKNKPYSNLFVTMLNRESGEETRITIYPATRVELRGSEGRIYLNRVFTVDANGEWEERE